MEAIVVAAIAAVGTVLAALAQSNRKQIKESRVENRDDHNRVAGLLSNVKDELLNLHHKIDHVDEQVDKVEGQMHDHMMWHYEKSDPTPAKKTRARKGPNGA
jgi:hypothetical protein